MPLSLTVKQRGGRSGERGIRTLGRLLTYVRSGVPPPSSARPFGPARFLPPPNSVLAASPLRAEWREAVAATKLYFATEVLSRRDDAHVEAALNRTSQHARLHRRQRAGLRERRTLRATPVVARATRRGRGTQPAPEGCARRVAGDGGSDACCSITQFEIRSSARALCSAASLKSHRIRSGALVRAQGSPTRRVVSSPSAPTRALHR